MKTAVSVPNEIFESAEALARRKGQSRSQLYSAALKNYLQIHSNDDVTKQLNKLYNKTAAGLHPTLQKLQTKSMPKEEW